MGGRQHVTALNTQTYTGSTVRPWFQKGHILNARARTCFWKRPCSYLSARGTNNICLEDSSSCPLFLHIALAAGSITCRRHLNVQWPVNTSFARLQCFLSKASKSLHRFSEGPSIKRFYCLRPGFGVLLRRPPLNPETPNTARDWNCSFGTGKQMSTARTLPRQGTEQILYY
jgi:hypothetical protein